MSDEPNSANSDAHVSRWIDRLQDAVDGALAASDASLVQAHLAECAACRAEYDKLMQVDSRLRAELSATIAPSKNFDARLLARIDALEADLRARAKQRELREFEQRMTQFRDGWRAVFRFHLGNAVGVAVVLAAIVTAVVGMLPTIDDALDGAHALSFLSQGGVFGATLAMMGVAGVLAAASIWILSRLERRGGFRFT